ncbi:Lrp/AsnC family transcriptional regulator [Streptomyces sp. NPDC088554]|uniref:Lrp/AsnC family transcriptional regulator n=1 Tax=Streptomyces sp. NPDC088554 TaxID=3365865 RepID=UPI00380C89DA
MASSAESKAESGPTPQAGPPAGPRPCSRPGGAAAPAVDSVSLGIIEQLQQDGRRPYAAIGRAVGLSEAAVRQRVQKLIDQGVMRIVAVTDPVTAGFRRQAMVGVKVEGDTEAVADALSALDECAHVVMTAGSFDLMVEIVCVDDDHLLHVINKRIRALPGVRSTESFVYLKVGSDRP